MRGMTLNFIASHCVVMPSWDRWPFWLFMIASLGGVQPWGSQHFQLSSIWLPWESSDTLSSNEKQWKARRLCTSLDNEILYHLTRHLPSRVHDETHTQTQLDTHRITRVLQGCIDEEILWRRFWSRAYKVLHLGATIVNK
jgi:hypothetical protein